MGNRVWKRSTVSSQTTTRKYIVDIASGLPTILMEIDPCETDPNRSITTKYYYANAQILKREQLTYGAAEVPGYDEDVNVCDEYYQQCIDENWYGDPNYCKQYYCHTEQQWVHPIPMEVNTVPHYYIHDWLGSIRLVVNDVGDVNNSYMYSPYGADLAAETIETADNPFKFTGQWYDSEIGQYYLRARMYDPQLMRFTGRDPVRGKYENPLTFNPYLYCQNGPINFVDPSGTSMLDTLYATMEGMYSELKEAAAAVRGLKWAKAQIEMMSAAWNGMTQGWLNVVTGPDNVPDNYKFTVGALGGMSEVLITYALMDRGWGSGAAAGVGAAVSSAMINGSNSYMSGKSLSWGDALDIGLSAGVAVLAGKVGLDGVEEWLLDIDTTLTKYNLENWWNNE